MNWYSPQKLSLLSLFRQNYLFRDYIFHWVYLDSAWWEPLTSHKHTNNADTASSISYPFDSPVSHLRYASYVLLRKTTTMDFLRNNLSSSTNYEKVAILTNKLKLETYSSFLILVTYSTSYHYFNNYFSSNRTWVILSYLQNVINRTFSFGFTYIQGLIFILFIDACLTDDEPLWEPIEWSLVQSWILIIFSFAWIAENLIVSRYGSYTGRDKRVWLSWYKTFWLIEGYYIINYGAACMFVIVPFYFETNYNLSFVYSWWHWYSRVFFFKFISLFSLILLMAHYLQINVRFINWKKGLLLIILINIFLSYLIFVHFIMTFLGYLTDPVWYQKTRPIDYVQLSHEPARWGWGPAKKDHFTYHNVKTVFWFKNDGPFASSFLLFHMFLFLCLFMLYFYWITLFRRVYSMQEIPLTLTTYCTSSLKQFFYFFMFMFLLVVVSYLVNFARFPIEFSWSLDSSSWLTNFITICSDYPQFIISIFLS